MAGSSLADQESNLARKVILIEPNIPKKDPGYIQTDINESVKCQNIEVLHARTKFQDRITDKAGISQQKHDTGKSS